MQEQLNAGRERADMPSSALQCGAGGARLSASYSQTAPGPVAPSPSRQGRAKRLRAALRAVAVLALVLAALLAAALARSAAPAPRSGSGPRRALSFVPVYALFPYAKMLDCFTLGLLPLFPGELLTCVAYTTV